MSQLWHEHDGLRLAVSETGAGQPMVFQHGLCGDGKQPAEVFPYDAGWRCLTLECRGHGQSEAGPHEAFSLVAFAADVVSLIEKLRLGPVVLGGISMGAAISTRIAVTRPELVGALVLARPAWLDGARPPNMAPNALVGGLLRRYPPEEARARFEASDIARRLAREGPDNLVSLRSFFSRQPLDVTAELLCRISADGPGVTRREMEALRVPTLVMGNSLDFAHPLEMARELAKTIPGARMVDITSKAVDRELYGKDFRATLAAFLRELG